MFAPKLKLFLLDQMYKMRVRVYESMKTSRGLHKRYLDTSVRSEPVVYIGYEAFDDRTPPSGQSAADKMTSEVREEFPSNALGPCKVL